MLNLAQILSSTKEKNVLYKIKMNLTLSLPQYLIRYIMHLWPFQGQLCLKTSESINNSSRASNTHMYEVS